MTTLWTRVATQLLLARARCASTARRDDRAQSTAEYALILVAVTAMVGVVIAYLTGPGGGAITDLFGAVFSRVRSLVNGG